MKFLKMLGVNRCCFHLTKAMNLLTFRRMLCLSKKHGHKVSILGCSGGVGQPFSLLLKQNTIISELALYDRESTYGILADLSHIDTAAKVTGYECCDELKDCLTGSKIVVISAGIGPRAGMTRGDALLTNGTVIADLSKSLAKYCPNAFVCIISDPIESLVPLCTKILKRCGVNNTKRIFGVTNLRSVQAKSILTECMDVDVENLQVPVVGGHTRLTAIPLLSQAKPRIQFENYKEYMSAVKKIQMAWFDIFKAKSGMGSSTLSMAYAASNFVESILKVLDGKRKIVECAFVESDVTLCPYFSSPFVLGPNGIEKCLNLGKLSDVEVRLVSECIPDIFHSIRRGEEFADQYHIN